MKRSRDRILTTHTGSLPRPNDLVQLMFAREEGKPVDEKAVHERVRSAVSEIVHKQVDVGLDVINDGEMGKVAYSTYVKDRLTGFEGEGQLSGLADMADFPEYAGRLFTDPAIQHLKTPACNGPIKVKDREAVKRDIENLKAAAKEVKFEDMFMTAASPGVISLFLTNRYYPSHEAYLQAIAEAMREEYRSIVEAGIVLQVDCPDLAMGRHIQFADLSIQEFRKRIGLHVEVLNGALDGLPPEQLRMHLCWGNYEGPHHKDVELKEIIDIVLRARPSAILLESCNPRHEHEWAVFQDVKLQPGKILVPGVIDSTNNYIEHPDLVAQRLVRFANLVGRENVMAGADCGFGTFVGLSTVDPKITWAKFQAMAEGARVASKQLWREPAMAAR
jgi:5-methyltetrahydropteroyltriglutamate--homocysteine methyltransferase